MKYGNFQRLFIIILIGVNVCMSLQIKSVIESDSDSDRSKKNQKKDDNHQTTPHHRRRTVTTTYKIISNTPGQVVNSTNETLSTKETISTNVLYESKNNTLVKQDITKFDGIVRKWNDNKVQEKLIEEINNIFIYQQEKELTLPGVRASINIFIKHFELCDTNHDNVLNLEEFIECMKNDTYLNDVIPTFSRFASYANYSFTNSTGFYPILFRVIDNFKVNYINLYDYMLLRLMVFSWKKCSAVGPFIEELGFECAVDIVGGWRTLSRNMARHLYLIALELSNSHHLKKVDFITYVIIAQSARLYGRINVKLDQDATKNEFNLALDSGIIPPRYNQDIINQLFQLVEEKDKPNQGIDMITFVYYDFALKLFDQPENSRRWYMNVVEFANVLTNYLFPWGTLQEIESIPQNNLTDQSYQMYTYHNHSQFHQEADHFLKFTQKNDKKIENVMNEQKNDKKVQNILNEQKNDKKIQSNLNEQKNIVNEQKNIVEDKKNIVNEQKNIVNEHKNILNDKKLKINLNDKHVKSIFHGHGKHSSHRYKMEGNGNMTFNLNLTAGWIFSVIDNNADGWINFYDFGNFLQIGHLYNKFDTDFKGRVICGHLLEQFSQYSDFPYVSHHIRERAKRLNLLPQDLYLDLLRTTLLLRIDDIIKIHVRKTDPSTLYEVELKNIFSNVNLGFVPDAHLNTCLRGVDDYKIPKYDWECAFLQAITSTALYLESSHFYLVTKEKNLNLANTVFINVDPSIQ